MYNSKVKWALCAALLPKLICSVAYVIKHVVSSGEHCNERRLLSSGL
jgi:hypothetical protein